MDRRRFTHEYPCTLVERCSSPPSLHTKQTHTNSFLLTASSDGTIAMWTLNGAMVCQFGQSCTLNLDDSQTFRQLTPTALEPQDVDSDEDERVAPSFEKNAPTTASINRTTTHQPTYHLRKHVFCFFVFQNQQPHAGWRR